MNWLLSGQPHLLAAVESDGKTKSAVSPVVKETEGFGGWWVVWGGVQGFAKLPNGDGSNSATGTAGTLRRAVSDWIAGGALKSAVVATYGPIEDWDVSEVTNMKYVFSDFKRFNEDLSKWNTGAVTSMHGSKCTLTHSQCLKSQWPRLSLLRIFDMRQPRFSSDHNSHKFCSYCLCVL